MVWKWRGAQGLTTTTTHLLCFHSFLFSLFFERIIHLWGMNKPVPSWRKNTKQDFPILSNSDSVFMFETRKWCWNMASFCYFSLHSRYFYTPFSNHHFVSSFQFKASVLYQSAIANCWVELKPRLRFKPENYHFLVYSGCYN